MAAAKGQLVSLKEFEEYAAQHLPKNALDYYASGADGEQSLKENCLAFHRLRIRPTILRDVSNIDMTVSILGETVDFPICVAPTALHRMAHPDGEIATAKACASMGICMAVSSSATTSMDDIAAAAPEGKRWFQLDVYRDRSVTLKHIRRAEKAGYKAFAVTVDMPVFGQRLRSVKNGFYFPNHLQLGNYHDEEDSTGVKKCPWEESGLAAYVDGLMDPTFSWEDIDWLRSVTDVPIVLKGILTRESALEALHHGINGIIVSNHGARQLDGVPATIEVLPEVIEAVDGKIEVFFDGGIRRGTDAFKALALGAKAVFIGRPVLWGLAYKGEEGVKKVLQLLKDEFKRTMQLTGCRNLSEVKRSMVVHESHYWSKL